MSCHVNIISTNWKYCQSCPAIFNQTAHGIGKFHLITSQGPYSHKHRNHFVYVSSQWETMLQYNVVSDGLGAWTKWSLQMESENTQNNIQRIAQKVHVSLQFVVISYLLISSMLFRVASRALVQLPQSRLTHLSLDEMATILQMIISCAVLWMNIFVFW